MGIGTKTKEPAVVTKTKTEIMVSKLMVVVHSANALYDTNDQKCVAMIAAAGAIIDEALKLMPEIRNDRELIDELFKDIKATRITNIEEDGKCRNLN